MSGAAAAQIGSARCIRCGLAALSVDAGIGPEDARSWCRIGEALALDCSNVRLHEQSARTGMSKNGEIPKHSITGHYANDRFAPEVVIRALAKFYYRGRDVFAKTRADYQPRMKLNLAIEEPHPLRIIICLQD